MAGAEGMDLSHLMTVILKFPTSVNQIQAYVLNESNPENLNRADHVSELHGERVECIALAVLPK